MPGAVVFSGFKMNSLEATTGALPLSATVLAYY
ncbi:Protein of unknown function [Bacillus cereus]|uniref:Uncharacterized protein n=1 Tax=Bacillus wiedmannii TaxID=1890302 RepID=A0AB37Z1X9_9BACI|nr:Protein of unknown function [Bacillus wiedmannii]SCC69714.1 Protein of unknown function [Bacillus cereus]SCN41754.1 Protein of unknown function [Bacillus wiedmannii]